MPKVRIQKHKNRVKKPRRSEKNLINPWLFLCSGPFKNTFFLQPHFLAASAVFSEQDDEGRDDRYDHEEHEYYDERDDENVARTQAKTERNQKRKAEHAA